MKSAQKRRITTTLMLALLLFSATILVVARAAVRPVRIQRDPLSQDTTFQPRDNPHVITSDLVVPVGITLTLQPGTELQLATETSLLVYGQLRAIGTSNAPITFTWRDEGEYWGAIALIGSWADNQLVYTQIAHAGEEPDLTPRGYGVTVRDARLTLAHSEICDSGSRGLHVEEESNLQLLNNEIHHIRGDALHADGGQLVIQGNHIHDIAWQDHNYEGLSLNNLPPHRPATVSDNHIHHVSDDCLDLNDASALIQRNRLHHCGDKGISIGSLIPRRGAPALDSTTHVVNNLIYANLTGIAIKDSAVSHLINNTIVAQQNAGLALYQDHPDFGGGQATVVNTILWDNGTAITQDRFSTVSVTFSNIKGGWTGQGNLNVDPLFSDRPNHGDYRLTQDSPCRDVGLGSVAPPTDLDGLSRPVGPAPDLGAYEWPPLRLHAWPGDKRIDLLWHDAIDPVSCTHYTLCYAALPAPGSLRWTQCITGLPATAHRYSLGSLTNGRWYTATVKREDAKTGTKFHSNTVTVMPSDQRIYLPLTLRRSIIDIDDDPNVPFPLSPATRCSSYRIYLPIVSIQPPLAPPRYDIDIAPQDLEWLNAHLRNRELVPAQFVYQGFAHDVGTRYRGEIARWLPKKSWKVQFESNDLFQQQREINLNAEYPDKSLMREWLGYDLFARAGLVAPRANFVQLYVNGEYYGLFTQVEQVDQRFLDRVGLDPNGNLYKGDYGSFHKADTPEQYLEQYVKKTNKEDSYADIMAFIERIHDTPAENLPAVLAARMDIGAYLDWYAIQTLIGNFEWVEKNYYLYHDLVNDRWLFIPWDLDLSFGHNHTGTVFDEDISWDNPIDGGTENSPKYDGVWNQLTTAILENQDFRGAYCRRLRKQMHDAFSLERMSQRIDLAYQMIQPYGQADPYKWGQNPEFNQSPDELKTYVRNRLAWLTEHLPTYCPSSETVPVVNEVMSQNKSTRVDEKGEFEPWIELYNPSLVSFDVGGMQLDDGTTRWSIPQDTVLPPGAFLLLWADGEPHEGMLHTSFRLKATGGQINLIDQAIHGGEVLAHLEYGPLSPDLSFGRQYDGGADLLTFFPATPGWSNRGRPPCISDVQQTPAEPDATQRVTITTIISAEHTIVHVQLGYRDGLTETAVSMQKSGDSQYSVVLPAYITGTLVHYHIRVRDDAGLTAIDPPQPLSAQYDAFPKRTYHYRVGYHRPPLHLNEFLAINDDGQRDEKGDADDWFEIYNAGSQEVDLGGMYLTDAIEHTTKWQIPTGVVVPARGYVVFWADNEPKEGPTHVGFKLDGDSERLALYASQDEGHELVDEIYYGPQAADWSMGRYPDGSGDWRALPLPTPGQANRQPPPLIHDTFHTPNAPQPGQPVVVTARITDDKDTLTATLSYSVENGWHDVNMVPTMAHLYTATIPPQDQGTTVIYHIKAQDAEGGTTYDPPEAPTVVYGYHVGQTSRLLINELMADNTHTLSDERGEFEDWIELYNGQPVTVALRGLYLSDDMHRPAKWSIPAGTLIAPGDLALIWADDDPDDGPLHASFKLNKSGEALGLLKRHGAVYLLLDQVRFGPQRMDISYGRASDGASNWTTFAHPTPGTSNSTTRRQ